MTVSTSELVIATLNIQGQSGLGDTKQKLIESFIKHHQLDILHLQEVEIISTTFQNCTYILSHFNIIQNNSPFNKYGTATLVRSDLSVDNIQCDTNGRVIVFNIQSVTFSNFYLPAGNDKDMRQSREKYLSETIPQLIINKKDICLFSGDYNCIMDKKDSLKYQDQKMSPSLKRFVSVFSLSYSFSHLHPDANIFS